MKPMFLIAALVSAFFTTTLVSAQDEPAATQADEQVSEGKRPHRKHMHEQMKRMRGEHMLQRADTNEDGQIDLAEFLRNAEQRFADMDQNSDGYVTREEMQQTHKDMRKRHHKAMKEARKAYKKSQQESE